MTFVHCFDTDHQGKNARYAFARRHVLMVFGGIAVGGRWITFDRDTLLAYGVAAPCPSDAAAGKMDDLLAAKSFSGKHCLRLRHRLGAAIEGMDMFYQRASHQRGALDFETDFELLAALIRLPEATGRCCHGYACTRPCMGNCRAQIASLLPHTAFALSF
jgi:hypothetical protein